VTAPAAPVAPRLRSIAARLAWVSVLGGVLLALVLALGVAGVVVVVRVVGREP